MIPFTASVPPLFARAVVKYARNAGRHRRRVRPRRAISRIGQVWNEWTTFSAILAPGQGPSGGRRNAVVGRTATR